MSDEAQTVEAIQGNAFVGQLKSFAAGGFGGICAVLVGHPFDLVKVRLQTAPPGTYNGAIDAVKKTIAHDGSRGLYRGVVAPLLGVTPMFAISFWGYDLGQRIVRAVAKPADGQKLTIAQISAAGFISAIPTTAIAAPFERVKVILQLQGQSSSKSTGNVKTAATHAVAEGAAKVAGGTNVKAAVEGAAKTAVKDTAKTVVEGAAKTAAAAPKQFNGAIDVVSHLYKEGGLKSVFKGSLATLARDGPGSALYFATYEYLKQKLTPEGQSLSLGAISFAGGMAGMAMWIPVFPIDTIKSNLQSSDKPQGISQVTKNIYLKGGYKAFFPGIGPALCRAFPANAATFMGVELAHKFFTSLGA